MKKTVLAAAMAVAFAVGASQTNAQESSSTANASGGAGGTGGAAAGGNATGGTATNSNNTSGVASANGGAAQGGSGGAAQGGAASAQGGYVGTVSTGGSAASLGDVTVNFNQSAGALGKDGLGAGVDPLTGHIVTDNKIQYSGSYKVKNTPDVGIGGPASGPCNGFSAGIGFSVAGFGIGGNTSTVDEGCTARETARIAAMLGRMDIANAVLENLPAVQAALRAKADREAAARRSEAPVPSPATTTPLREDPKVQALREAAAKAMQELDQAKRELALKEQQNLAQEALIRASTMAKVNDTLKFTDATNQASEKTPQEIMAEEATRKLNAGLQQVAERKQEPQNQAAATFPLAPQQPIPSGGPNPTQQVSTPKTDGVKAVTQESKPLDQTSRAPTDERMSAAKAALNFR